MAGLEAFEAIVVLLKSAETEAVMAAEDAAADVYRQAIRAAAPRKTGQLQGSVRIYATRNRKALTGSGRKRVLVGPSKEKGYYGYFVEHGWKAPTGPRVTYTTKRGDRWNPKGHTYTTARRRRFTGGAASSQMGREGYREIPPRPWFESAVRGADAKAEQAAAEAFNAKVNELDEGI